MAWTAPKTWVDGVDSLSATNLNTHLRDNLKAATEWTAYTPTWTSTGTAPTVGNGTLSGRYIKAGNLCHYVIYWEAGSSTTYGTGIYRWGLPFSSPSGALYSQGAAVGRDSSGGVWATGVSYTAPNLGFIEIFGTSTTSATVWAQTVPWTWASGDWVRVSGTYEC